MSIRVVLVTSEVNYVGDNYRFLLENILRQRGEEIVGLVVIRTISFDLLKKIFFLGAVGCFGLAGNLLQNIFRSIFGRTLQSFYKRKVPIHCTKNINSDETLAFLKGLKPDLIVNARTRNIYRSEVLQIPRLGCINIHHGILPRYRGTMCDLWALASGRPVGYSIHWMNPKIDDGRLIRVRELPEIQTKKYAQVPYLSSLRESEDLVDILAKLSRGEQIAGEENRSPDSKHSRNPSLKQIKELQRKGISL